MRPIKRSANTSLGMDFWKFRLGQFVSLLGNGCSTVALSWWVLEKTGSAKAIAVVLVPAMVANLILLPLFGPLGDNFSRKKIIVLGDLTRFATGFLMALMVYRDFFDLGLLSGLYLVGSVGGAMFTSVESGIIPQIVPKEKLQTALQRSYALSSLGGVAGGMAGGLIVSAVGIFGAFAVDAGSFLIGGLSSSLIQADTVPRREKRAPSRGAVRYWKGELFDGFRMLFRIPVLSWVAGIAMLINFALAPLSVALPVFAKLGKGMPAWYLGGLESSIALGAIVGSTLLSRLQKLWRRRAILTGSIFLMGLGILALPWPPGVVAPLVLMGGVGLGSSLANIPLETQFSMVVPDSHRSRFNSIIVFLSSGLSPLGVAGAGFLIAQAGLTFTLAVMGALVLLLTPLLWLVPKLEEFLEVRAHKAGGFLKRNYPDVRLEVRE